MEGMVKIPFAYCCAEGGGDVRYCDCVNKNHGTAWSHPKDARNTANAAVAEDEVRRLTSLMLGALGWTNQIRPQVTEGVRAILAALARPRAAVGEREAWELPDLRDLHRDAERVRDHDLGNDRMRDLLRGAMDMLKAADVEYAALQSPPAKVEGKPA